MLKNKKKHLFNSIQKGFTYYEGIIAIIVTLVTSTAIAFSVQKAMYIYKSQLLKDRAAEALIQYTEDYRMVVAYGESPFPGKQPRGDGHEVTLYDANDEKDDQFTWSGKQRVVYGYLFHDVNIVKESSGCDKDLEEKTPYYNIKTWIEWNDIFERDTEKNQHRKNLAFEVNQAVIAP